MANPAADATALVGDALQAPHPEGNKLLGAAQPPFFFAGSGSRFTFLAPQTRAKYLAISLQRP